MENWAMSHARGKTPKLTLLGNWRDLRNISSVVLNEFMIIQRKGNRQAISATIRIVFETELKILSLAVSFETALAN